MLTEIWYKQRFAGRTHIRLALGVDVVNCGQDSLSEFVSGGHADLPEHAEAGKLGEEALDRVEPRAVLRREGKLEPTSG